MADQWRLAFMFDAAGGDHAGLEAALVRQADAIRRVAGAADIRLGVADRHPDLTSATQTDYAVDQWRTVDAAVEITVGAARAADLPALAAALSEILAPLAASGSVEVMSGPMFSMVPVRDGGVFLSLAFKRDPAISSAQFRSWWHDRHSGVAIPVLGPGLLAYDQVHCDAAATGAVARGFGAAPVAYDAYDNLTWADRQGYLASISDPAGMARIFADEIGNIDDGTRRHALMRRIG
ncbi:EthD domain-containing protein [Phenylobacterium sp. LjRoot219]|uniref:EthD domain-containing protein n=1 Tax=Phenylobacterium sp. LjRoot219 TaxID=3342283 RepID=UPI003ED0A11C